MYERVLLYAIDFYKSREIWKQYSIIFKNYHKYYLLLRKYFGDLFRWIIALLNLTLSAIAIGSIALTGDLGKILYSLEFEK